ncbi:hypothetical protein JL722_2318 [Aureococcus anophagefferens]|nr:hypothetical protein JL722_2318 [Aureococcus anophagefferens]
MPASGHAPKSFAQPKAMEPIELLCLEDNTTQVHSSVGIDTPLFQPYPTEVRFRDYAPFSCIERTLRFRNNDHVARRIKVLQPKSPYFEVSGPHARGKDVTLKQSKVATGMEVCFVVKFRPQEVREYKVDLVCCTEREKFIVPVRAFGLRAAALSLPEEVDFGTAAVKSTKQRSLLVQNIGACTAVFKLSCDTPEIFQASPSESITQVGQMATLELSFTPQKVEPYSGTLLVEFLGDETRVVTVALKGIAEDVDVHLSANSVALEPAYVSLSSQTTFRIRNASEIPVLFSWKQFSNMAEQEAERSRLHSDLERMQQLEEAHLEETLRQDELAALAHHGHGFSNQPQSDESDGDLSGDEGNVPGATRAARSALTTKYRHLRQALEKDDMVFADENFEIKPLSGEVRALSEIEVSVTFRPDTAADYACTAYLDVMGREERLPIWLTGLGIGPKGALSYDVLDMGDVFISSPYEYSLGITNKGDIPAEWKLFPPPTTTFQFSPTSGVLAVGGSEELTVHFMGTTLGEFCELVDVALDGSNEKLTCQFKGHVIGPTFNFDIDIIEFGLCSYSFAHVRTLDLTNTADIPMDFNLSIPQDGQFGRHEFVVEPRTGTLPPGETVRVSVTLTPMSVKVYDFYLVVDVPGVGDALLSLPISAECLVPDVTVAEQELDFERCFLRYPYERELVLVNGHDQLSARYAVAAQEPQTTVVGEYACEPGAGVIPPGGIVRVTVTVRCHKLGNFRLPLTTSIAGSAQPPLAATMTAVVCGPDLSIEPKELSWGATECLVDAPRTVTLRNNCCIPAPFKTFVKNARSKFRVDVRESVLAPMDAVDLQVVACLDDTTMHRDQLHVVVAEGENLMMPLSARGGIGTTMFCHEDLKVLDFGAQFTANFFERKITLENKGRRPQVLKPADDKEKKGPGGGKDSSAVVAKPKANVGAPTFTVVPEEVELRPRTAAIFTFRGYSTHKGLLEEKMVCETRVHKEKQSKPVFYTTVKADVIEPLLSFSSPSLGFVHDHEPDVPIQPHVDAWEHTLEPDEETTVRVDFDPGYKGDRQSQKLDTRLTVAYHQHPQRDSVGLVFDILPIRSRLKPGEVEDVDFIYYGHAGRKFKGTCLCEVEGGPEYHIVLLGEASTVGYKLDRASLDFGNVLYTKSEDLEFNIVNTGKVAFPFTISLGKSLDLAGLLAKRDDDEPPAVGPSSCASSRACPKTFRENLVIEVAHFEPVDFPITGTGIYASVSVSLPRDAKKMAHNLGADLGTTWASAISKTREFLQQERLNAAELLPPPPPAATTQPFAAPLPMASSAAGAAAAIAANDAQTDPASTTPPSDSAPPSGAATPKPSTAQTTGAMREPSFTMAEIEAETNRRIFLDHLKKEEEKRRSHSRPTRTRATTRSPHPPPTASSHGGDGHDHGFVLAWHACDFGNVVSGTHRKRTFRITNSSLTGPLSWFFEKKVLANTGFSIEPEKVVRLAEGATATFEVNFNAKKSLRLGHKELLLPVDVKNGPLTCIVLQANVTMPDISLSAEALDFGPVWVGCGRTMHVQIHNTSPVLAEWDFKKAMGAARDEARFTLSPRSGALLPGRKQNVAVEFVPVDDRPCSLKLPLKVNQSTKTWLVNFAGAGVTAKLQFSPSVVEIGPVLPFEDGTGRPGTTATTVTMKNASDRPVEVFSLDFDDEYVTEEAFLSTYDAFGEDGLLRLPVRNLGEKLPINMDPPVEEDAGPEGEEEEGEEPPAEEAGEEAAAEEAAVAPDDGLEDDADALGGAADGETPGQRPREGRVDLGKKARKALGCEVPGDAPPEPAEGEEPPAEPAEGEEGYVPPEPEPSLDDPNFLAACLAWRAGRADSGRGLVVDASEPAPGAPVLEVVAGAVPLALPGSTMATLTLSDAQYLARLKALDDEAARTSHALEGLVDPPLAETQNIGEAAAAPEDGEEAAKLPSRALLKAQMVDKARPSARAPEPPHDAADDPKRVVGGVAVLRTAAATVQSRMLEVADDALPAAHVAFAEASAKATAAFEAVVAAEAQAKADAEAAEKLAPPRRGEAGEEPPAEEEAAEDVLEEEQPPPRCVTFGVVEEPVVEVPAEEPAAEGADEPDAAADDAASAAARGAERAGARGAGGRRRARGFGRGDAPRALPRRRPRARGAAPGPVVVPIPPAVTQQLVRRPPPRAPRSTQQHFTIVAAPPTTPEPVEGEEDEEADAAEPEPAGEGGDEPPAKPKRWVIPAQSQVQFAVNFLSTQVGRSHASLGFEVVGLPSHEFTLPCVGSCAVPTINGDPRNVFMTRVKNRPPPRAQPLSKRFVLNANEFEFGPLLTWKQPPMRLPAPEREEGAPEPTPEEAEAAQAAAELRTLVRGTNCDTFRMSNNGPFATAVDFHFRTSEPPADGGAEDPEQPCVFYADPPRMELEPGETRDLEVWAFPSAQGACDDTLLACVAMNPEPYAFAVRCAGVEPELTLSGPWSDGDGVTAPDDEPAADEPPPTPVLDFDRLLLGRSEMREFTLTNANLCPVAWRLDLAALEPFARELRVEPASGRLGIHGSARITVSFSAVEPLTLDPTLFVEYSDDEGGLQSEERVRKLELVVKAEAYLIRAIVLDEDPDKPPEDPKAAAKGKGKGAPAAEEVDPADEKTQPGTLDFGQMRVGETAQLGFALRNRGKYDFSFKFGFRRAAYTEIFSVSPSEGLIEADGSVRVVVSFCSRRVKLSDNKDISCTISEPITGEAVESFPVTVAATSLFPRFRVQPGRGLTFGTVKFNDPPKERKFDLRNEGKFSFAFAIADADGDMDATARKRLLGATPLALIATADEDEAVEMGLLPAREEPDIEEVEDEAPEDAEKRRAERALAIAEERRAFYAQAPSVGDAEAPPDGAVSLGQFVVAPGGGVVEPGQSLQVTVTFNPEGCAVHKGNLRIAVAGCDGRDSAVAAASAYELFAESRSPGINCADFYQIFEEQAVIASLGDADGGDPGAAAKAGSIFATKEKVFSFGTTALTDDDKGFGERFKITNPNKVAAVVNFAISPKAAEGGREDPRSVGGADVFTVQPANCEVPPHEHRYVTVYFHANEMREYRAMFAATVEDSAEAETGALSFELAGRGTLPSVAIEGVDHGDGGQSLDFGRLQVGRSRSRTLTVRNDGVLNATALVNFNVADRHFGCAHAGGSVQLSPGESRDVTVTFKALPWAPLPEGEPATEARDVSAKLALKVLDNKYEATTVVLKGATFETDVSIEKLPDDVEDELKFGELNLASGETALTAEFTVRNLRPRTVRFEWPDHATVAFSPKVGHLLPGGSRTVTATFTPGAEPLSLDEELSLDTQQIALTPPAEDDESPLILDTLLEGAWDSDARVEREATAAERAIIDGAASEDDRPKERRASNAKDKGKKGEPAGDAGELPPGVAAGPVTDDGAQLVVVAPGAGLRGRRGQAGAAPQADMPSSRGRRPRRTRPRSPAEDGAEAPRRRARPRASGRATRPACHIDLNEDGDYLARRQPNLLNEHGHRDQIEATNVRIVEVSSRGLRVQNTKRFHVVNPTASSYDFVWEPSGQPHAAWRCGTPRGMILSGKRGEMVFEFTPNTVGVAEAFYRFKIPEHGIDELFLFVGQVVEPRVTFDRTRVDFNAVMLGNMASETVHLVNSEHLPFAFNFEKPGIDNDGPGAAPRRHPTLEISPLSGLVPPNGRAAIELSFRPGEESLVNTNLMCTVRKKTMKLNLNLKGEGYAVHSKLMLLEGVAAAQAQKDGELLDSGVGLSVGDGISELHPSPAVNVVDFGTVHLNQTLTKTLAIANSGKFNFDYVIDRGANPNPMLVLSGAKSSGTVRKNGRILATLTFHPVSPCVLDGAQYVVAVAGKYEYVLKIVGRGVAPNLRFSFSDHDFGPCFIVVPGQPPTRESVVLRVSNQDPHAHLSLDCTLPRNKVLVVECGPRVLAPGEHVEVVLHFTPREMQDYAFPVPFLINGVSTVTVLVKGRGVAARLELVQPSQASCAFGLVREGEDMVKHVQVINRSARALGFDLVDEKDALAKADVTLSPATVSHLRPRGVTTIEVRFSPKRRQREFSEPVFVRYAGGLRQLLTVSGRATGMEVALSTDTLSFGAVCEGSRRTRRLQLENSGDIATRFQWNRSGLGDLFTISPLEGVLRASSEVAFDVTFTPTRGPGRRVGGMQLFVEGAAPLRLACVGACVPQPDESKQTLDFESVARRADVKSVVVKNPTNKPWFLAPTLKHMEALEHFKAPGEVSVPANGEAALDVSYFPLTMTVDDEPPAEDAEPAAEGEEREARKHVAELFIALPDGSALLYHLRGAAGPPETLVHEPMSTAAKARCRSRCPCPTGSARRSFDVAFSLDDETASLDSTFLEGTSTFDVEAAETRAYVLRFFSYKVGKTVAVARFTNPASGEYLEHSVEVEVTPAGVISALSLEAPVRQTARRLITIENPLPKDVSVTFPEDWWRCDNPHVKLAKVGTMQGSPEGVFEVEFRPLVPHDRVEASLSFDIEELGEFKYTLTLGATPPAAIPQIKFEAPLGGAQVETFSFPAFPLGASGGGAAKFACSVAKAKFFEVASSIDADVGDEWEGKEVQLQIRFEPEALGAISDVLVVDGGDRGEYRATLTGVCKRPEPRGPFTIEAGGKCDVEFRNVFSEAREFVFTVDHPEFAVAAGKANINARSPYTASVSFTPVDPADGSAPPPVVTARMLVDCVDPAGEAVLDAPRPTEGRLDSGPRARRARPKPRAAPNATEP